MPYDEDDVLTEDVTVSVPKRMLEKAKFLAATENASEAVSTALERHIKETEEQHGEIDPSLKVGDLKGAVSG